MKDGHRVHSDRNHDHRSLLRGKPLPLVYPPPPAFATTIMLFTMRKITLM